MLLKKRAIVATGCDMQVEAKQVRAWLDLYTLVVWSSCTMAPQQAAPLLIEATLYMASCRRFLDSDYLVHVR